MKFIKTKFASSVLIFAVVLFTSGIFPMMTDAAQLVNAKDTMTSQVISATSDHTLTWTLASGKTNAAGGKVTVDFTEADFVTSGTWATTDFEFSDNVRTTQAPIAVGTGAASCGAGGATAYTVDVTSATSTFLITFCTGWTTSTTGLNTFKIKGTAADGLLTNKSSDVDSSLITITNSVNNTDSTTIAAVVETNDVVTVSATVNPTLTFAVSANTVGLGIITTSTAGKGSHTAQIATNSAGGFLLTYNGATLTGPGGTIAAYGSQQVSSPGTAGFGINMVSNATPAIGAAVTVNSGSCDTLPADYGTANKYSYIASTTTSLTNQTHFGDCTYTVSYVGNIASTTPAGIYTTPITYIASW